MLLACGMTLLGVRSGFRTLTVFMGLCGFTHGRLALALSCSAQVRYAPPSLVRLATS